MTSSPNSFWTSQRLSYAGQLCTVRYVGTVTGTTGTWLGVEWDNPTLGKHTGTHNGVKYFDCLSPAPTAASFVRPTRPHDPTQSFLDALRDKYVAEASPFVPSNKKHIFFNGKLAEEVGFEKVAAQQAALGELRIVVLDGLKVAGMKAVGNDRLHAGQEWNGLVREIASTCGNITELDLSRNLLESWADVVGICDGLSKLRKLVLDGNRFYTGTLRSDAGLVARHTAWARIEELSLKSILQTWDQISGILKFFPSLKRLSLASNNLSPPFSTPPTPDLTNLDLSRNSIGSFDAIIPFAALPNLSVLTLRECSITTLTPLPCHFPKLDHLDISSNNITSITSLSVLPTIFPQLTSLRCSSNPFYDSLPADEAHMLTLARLPSITMLNYSHISEKERENAELYYLSRIRTDLSKHNHHSHDDANEKALTEESLSQIHPQWSALASKHNQTEEFTQIFTDVSLNTTASNDTRDNNGNSNDNKNSPTQQSESRLINPTSLGARLVDLHCTIVPASQAQSQAPPQPQSQSPSLTLTLPKSISIYKLKSLIGRSTGFSPLGIRLVHETGEVDPVGRNIRHPGRLGEGRRIAEAESDSHSETETESGSDAEAEAAGEGEVTEGKEIGDSRGGNGEGQFNRQKWIRREVELVDSTRPLGYWVEGRRAVIRVEILDGVQGMGIGTGMDVSSRLRVWNWIGKE